MKLADFLTLDPAVAEALSAGQPVVALESTIIAHGMPYPRNLETARAVEAAVRENGAVPATIAVLEGRLRIGLDGAGLERLARADGVAKLSRRDLPVVLARRGDGATTVAATMIAAHLAGIRIFVTGGIGGVHRGAERTFDVSADLEELARTPVAVVCAGAKSILDLPKTLEYLETRGVPVIGYGTDAFPAFYCRSSGLDLSHRSDAPEDVASILRAQAALGYPGGMIIANPIPEADALPADEIDAAIGRALAEAETDGIGGKDVTPYLLARLVDLTGGRSLDANIALVMNNARIGARIAAALAAA
ncbi:MAG TPA: pseudouridine-5'-phosphate glycosidase [Alphaproteobacteria bacterium]|nr:pseudouridine-5'-phosphate glycosidase [Alphaproteobacteria bacterium]